MSVKLQSIKKSQTEVAPIPKLGEIVEGTIVATDRSAVFLDLGPRGVGIVFGNEFQKSRHILKNLKKGEAISTKIVGLENKEGYRELSVNDAQREVAWKGLRDKKEKGEQIEVKIKKINKGGLLTDVEGMPAFIPVSHLSPEHYPRVENSDASKIAKELQKFIGEIFKVKILDIDPKKGKLILSEKAKTFNKIDKEILARYKEGEKFDGLVTGITNFGAFVEIEPEVEGLLYPSEVPGGDKKKIEEIIKPGEKVKIKILKVTENRIYLSMNL